MRREAGLPDDDVYTGYTDADYRNAIMESAEPMISSDSGGGKKVRALSKEELALQSEVEERVMGLVQRSVTGSLESPRAAPPGPLATQITAGELAAKLKISTGDSALIDTVLNRVPSDPADKKAAFKAAMEKPAPPVKSVPPAAPAAPVSSAKPVPPAAPVNPVQSTKPAPQAASAGTRDFSAMVASAKKTIERSAETVEVQPAAPSGKKLSLEELDTAAKALQLLVRHRGGGPFGAGRLRGDEAAELVEALAKAQDMLVADSRSGAGAAQESKVAAAPVKAAIVPVPKKAAAPVPPAAPAVVKAVAPAPAPAKSASPAPTKPAPVAPAAVAPAQQSGSQPAPEVVVVTIAQGLDSFLLEPKKIATADLLGLRDGIIQCLGLIQTEIMSRPASGPANGPAAAPAARAPEEQSAMPRNKLAPPLSQGTRH